MDYRDEDIALRLQLGEDSRWELKRIDFSGTRPKSPSRDDLANGIAVFANAAGGILICGVTDKGDVQNLSREQLVALDAVLVEVSTDSIKPSVRIRTRHKQTPDGKRFLVVEIPRAMRSTTAPAAATFA